MVWLLHLGCEIKHKFNFTRYKPHAMETVYLIIFLIKRLIAAAIAGEHRCK